MKFQEAISKLIFPNKLYGNHTDKEKEVNKNSSEEKEWAEWTNFSAGDLLVKEESLSNFLNRRYPIFQWFSLIGIAVFGLLGPLGAVYFFNKGKLEAVAIISFLSLFNGGIIVRDIIHQIRSRIFVTRLISQLKAQPEGKKLTLSKLADQTTLFNEKDIQKLLDELYKEGVIFFDEPIKEQS